MNLVRSAICLAAILVGTIGKAATVVPGFYVDPDHRQVSMYPDEGPDPKSLNVNDLDGFDLLMRALVDGETSKLNEFKPDLVKKVTYSAAQGGNGSYDLVAAGLIEIAKAIHDCSVVGHSALFPVESLPKRTTFAVAFKCGSAARDYPYVWVTVGIEGGFPKEVYFYPDRPLYVYISESAK